MLLLSSVILAGATTLLMSVRSNRIVTAVVLTGCGLSWLCAVTAGAASLNVASVASTVITAGALVLVQSAARYRTIGRTLVAIASVGLTAATLLFMFAQPLAEEDGICLPPGHWKAPPTQAGSCEFPPY